jgi:RecA-family ATPase
MNKPNGKALTWRDKIITAEELRHKVFPPANFIIPTLLPEGLAILSGKPKAGKSFLALDLCIGVTTGAAVLGSIRPMIGDAIYCANEDTDRRLKGRIAKYLSPFDEWPVSSR